MLRAGKDTPIVASRSHGKLSRSRWQSSQQRAIEVPRNVSRPEIALGSDLSPVSWRCPPENWLFPNV